MAMRILATRVWTRRPPAAGGLPPANRSRPLATQVRRQDNRRLETSHCPPECLDDQQLSEELTKITESLMECNEEMEKVYAELKRIAKWYVYTAVGGVAWSSIQQPDV
ncbi:hypothetical protein ACP4OV_023301 [Aristida adscensionis]